MMKFKSRFKKSTSQHLDDLTRLLGQLVQAMAAHLTCVFRRLPHARASLFSQRQLRTPVFRAFSTAPVRRSGDGHEETFEEFNAR